MAIIRQIAITLIAVLGLAACDPTPGDAPSPLFSDLENLYQQIEDSIFPGSRTPPDGLPSIGGYWDGVARLGYFEDGTDFTFRVNADMSMVADFISNQILSFDGEGVTGFITEDGRSWPGTIRIDRNAFTGNTFSAIIRGTLMIDGEEAQVRGRIRGSFFGVDGRYAFGNIGFAGPDLSPRFSGTFALRRRGIP